MFAISKRVLLALALVGGSYVALEAQLPSVLRVGAPPSEPPPPVDTNAPTCAITSPTSRATHDNGANDTINLNGTCADDDGTVVSVRWACATCTPTSGDATGTTSWSMSGIVLSDGTNTIDITGTDDAAHTGADSIDVDYAEPGSGRGMCGMTICIDTVSDATPSNGQTITLTTVLAQDLQTAHWASWFTLSRWSFEAASNGAAITADGYQVAGGGAVADTSIKILGSKSARFDGGPATCCPGGYAFVNHNNTPFINGITSEAFVGYYVRYHRNSANWPHGVMKQIISWGGRYFQLQMPGRGRAPTAFYWAGLPGYEGSVSGGLGHSGAFREDRWYYVDLRMKGGTPLTIQAWVNDVQVTNSTTVGAYAGNINLLDFGVVNATGTPGVSYDFDVYWDGLAMSATSRVRAPTRVYLGDSSNFASAKKVYQFPEFSSDGSVSFVFDKGSLSCSTCYVFIVNNNQDVSAGFPVNPS